MTQQGGVTIPWGNLNNYCWDNSGAYYNNEALTAVMLQVPGTTSGVTTFSFCLNDIRPAP